jgi:predicted GNAT family N-acyltransferase
MSLLIRTPETAEELKACYKLRWQLLRAPWGEPEGSETDAIEDQCFHLMAVDDNNVIGVGRMQYNTPYQAQLRYMAVASDRQGNGIGRMLVEAFEHEAKHKGVTEIVLDAREAAVPFYEHLGYSITEKSYLLFDSIQHYRMHKQLG